MSRAGLRALHVGPVSALVRPKALACLALLSLAALLLLSFGLHALLQHFKRRFTVNLFFIFSVQRRVIK